MGNFYPRSPCGERLRPIDVPQYQILISIHALLAESDETFIVLPKELYNFYPRSPCGERHILCVVSVQIGGFLSTLSLRRATREPTALRTPHHKFLSTLSLRRATREAKTNEDRYKFLSTLSLRRATTLRQLQFALCGYFYPRSPCGERRFDDGRRYDV